MRFLVLIRNFPAHFFEILKITTLKIKEISNEINNYDSDSSSSVYSYHHSIFRLQPGNGDRRYSIVPMLPGAGTSTVQPLR